MKKSEFSIGDKCVYIEIDSVLEERPEYEFLRSKNFRIKSQKIRKCLSQGIVFPMSILPDGEYNLEDDVSEIVGASHYEKPISATMSGIAKGNFPSFISKTDETMIQSVKSVLEELEGIPYYISTKIDGSSSTYFYHPEKGYGACSRRLEVCEGDSVFWQVGVKYGLADKLRKFYLDYGIYLSIQGEIAGPGIQKNRLKLSDHELFVFNVYDNKAGRFYDFHDMLDVCQELNLQTVPIEEIGGGFNYTLDELLQKADGRYSSGNIKEGIVIRPQKEMYSQRLYGRLSVKCINNKFLLKEGE